MNLLLDGVGQFTAEALQNQAAFERLEQVGDILPVNISRAT
jgi:hypothetical protein